MTVQKNSAAELTAQLLEDVVRPCPVIDIHTHIRPAEPCAKDMGEIVFYHYLVTELEAAGVDRARIAGAKSAEEKLALFAGNQRLVSNTVTYWCLRQVLAPFGIDRKEPVTEAALAAAARKLSQSAADPAAARKALVERNKIQKTFLTLNVTEALPKFDASLFAGTLRLDDVLSDLSTASVQALAEVSGEDVADLASFERALGRAAGTFAKSGGRALTAGMPTDEEFVCADRPSAEKLFSKMIKSESPQLCEKIALHSYLLRYCAGLARDLRLPVQLLLGVRRPLPGNAAIPVIRRDLAIRFAGLFNDFSGVRFDLLLSSAVHSQELIAVAKNYPNVSLAGHWWYAFSPPYIRAMLTERLLALPAVKLHGFFSDAYNVEWSAGKLALLRQELARVLAELIISGYLVESQAPEIARALLYENPNRFYGLGLNAE